MLIGHHTNQVTIFSSAFSSSSLFHHKTIIIRIQPQTTLTSLHAVLQHSTLAKHDNTIQEQRSTKDSENDNENDDLQKEQGEEDRIFLRSLYPSKNDTLFQQTNVIVQSFPYLPITT